MYNKNVLSVKNLNKIYSKKSKPINALNDLNLDVQEGEIFGLLGPNGAGKTTFIKLLTGQLRPSSGIAKVLGITSIDILKREAKYKLSYVPQEILIWEDLTVLENIMLMGKLYGFKGSELLKKQHNF